MKTARQARASRPTRQVHRAAAGGGGGPAGNPTYVQSGAAGTYTTVGTSPAAPYPASPTSGNRLIMCLFTRPISGVESSVPAAPTGWTEITHFASGNGGTANYNAAMAVFTKVSDGTETGSATCTGTASIGQAQIHEFTASTVGNTGSVNNPGATIAYAPSFTSLGDCLIMTWFATNGGVAPSSQTFGTRVNTFSSGSSSNTLTEDNTAGIVTYTQPDATRRMVWASSNNFDGAVSVELGPPA